MSETKPAPRVLPVPNEDLKVLWHRAQQMFPKFIKGTQREVDPDLVALRDHAAAAAKAWETQVTLANIAIQQQMGDAEVATVNGVPVVKRYQYPVAGHWVSASESDYLKKTGK